MAAKPLVCTHCNGEMTQYSGPRHNRKVAGFFIILGIVCVLFWVGMVLGIPLILIGIYMLTAKRDLWVCKECNVAVERFNIDSETLGK